MRNTNGVRCRADSFTASSTVLPLSIIVCFLASLRYEGVTLVASLTDSGVTCFKPLSRYGRSTLSPSSFCSSPGLLIFIIRISRVLSGNIPNFALAITVSGLVSVNGACFKASTGLSSAPCEFFNDSMSLSRVFRVLVSPVASPAGFSRLVLFLLSCFEVLLFFRRCSTSFQKSLIVIPCRYIFYKVFVQLNIQGLSIPVHQSLFANLQVLEYLCPNQKQPG